MPLSQGVGFGGQWATFNLAVQNHGSGAAVNVNLVFVDPDNVAREERVLVVSPGDKHSWDVKLSAAEVVDGGQFKFKADYQDIAGHAYRTTLAISVSQNKAVEIGSAEFERIG